MSLNTIKSVEVSGTGLDPSHGPALARINAAIEKTNDIDTDKWSEGSEITLKVYEQDDEPELTEDHKMAIWIDTDDSDRVRLLFRRGSGDIVRTELA